jgi:S1-C subfamily serine protease
MNASVRLIELVLPATVALQTEIPAEHPSAQILGTERLGSGVVVDPNLILTVNYVVLGARHVDVTFLDDTHVRGTIAAQDFATGIAVVEAKTTQAPIKVRPLPLRIGEEIFIVAAAAENKRRAHDGAVTSLGPFDAYWEYCLDRAVLTTAMNPGLGGAALVDLLGRVAGIVSLELNEVGRFTLSIPIEHYTEHRDELLRHGRRVTRQPRAWIGFYCYSVREHIVIAGLLPGAPGDRAGLRAGDVVLTVDGQTVTGRRQLYAHLWDRRPGDVIHFRVHRNNEVKQIAVPSGDAEAFFS